MMTDSRGGGHRSPLPVSVYAHGAMIVMIQTNRNVQMPINKACLETPCSLGASRWLIDQLIEQLERKKM